MRYLSVGIGYGLSLYLKGNFYFLWPEQRYYPATKHLKECDHSCHFIGNYDGSTHRRADELFLSMLNALKLCHKHLMRIKAAEVRPLSYPHLTKMYKLTIFFLV